jgi:hypothetical protein
MTGENKKTKLIFVYNADSGAFNLLTDIAHKIFSPETYTCNLCAITHSNFGMKKEWKEYLETLDILLEFLHADEFKRKYPSEKIQLPAIFSEENGNIVLKIDAAAIKNCESVNDLKQRLNQLNLRQT